MATIPGLALLVLIVAAWGSPAQADETSGTLRLTVTDESGEPLPFRAYVIDSQGTSVLPDGIPNYVKKNRNSKERHVLADGTLTCDVPVGKYTVRVERGLEWLPHEERLAVKTNRETDAAVVLRRWVDMNARGWYSGDTHIHRAPEVVALAMSAEDLNFGANITHWNERKPLQVNGESIQVLGPKRVLCARAHEIEHFANGWGAILFIGDFNSIPLNLRPTHPWPAQFAADGRPVGAHLDHDKPWASVPVCAALGLVDSLGVVHNHFWPRDYLSQVSIGHSIINPPERELSARELAEYTLDLYYRLLNCGFRIGVSGGSASGVMPSPVGFERTYVELNGEFSANRWLEALREGRSFATNGPILTLEVDGHGLGDAIRFKTASTEVTIRCAARSQAPLERIEIVHNGNVIASTTAKNGDTAMEIEQATTVGPGWLAARCFQVSAGTQVFAATSPIYLEHGDRPFVVEESARYYRDYVQSVIDTAIETNQFPDPDERARALETLEQALAFYQNLLPY